MKTAEIFWSGHSQAVRLPKEFRFDVSEVRLRRQGTAVILEPIANDWTWLSNVVGSVDTDFEQAATEKPVSKSRTEAP